MAKTVRIKTGLVNVQLPNGKAYDGDKVVGLTDAEFNQIASTALGDEVLYVGGGVIVGADGNDLQYLHIPLELLSVTAAGDLATTAVVEGFAGTIRSVRFITDNPATTAAKAVTLALKIGATAVTGGAVALTTAGSATKGAVTNGTAVTATNVFTATDTLVVTASAVTAFTEGSGFLEVLVST